MDGSVRARVEVNSPNLPALRIPQPPEAKPTCWPRAPSPAPPHPDSLLGCVAATGHHSAGPPHAAEAAEVAGARDRHSGDSEVLGATKESIRGRGRGEGILPLRRCPPSPPLQPPPPPLPQREACPAPHPERVCHDLSSSVVGPLGEAYEELPA